MLIIGCDYHPGFQQIAFVDSETGECGERRLQHREEAEKFYRDLAAQGMKVHVGMEASGHARWFERLLAELNIELWMGDAAEIHSSRVSFFMNRFRKLGFRHYAGGVEGGLQVHSSLLNVVLHD
jgi:transposase